MRVENAGDAILENQGIVGDSHELVVHVAEAEGHLRADVREVAARQPPDDVALRRNHPPQRRDVPLFVEDLAHQLGPGIVEHLLLELVEAIRQLLDLGPVVIDHRIDDAMEQRRSGPRRESWCFADSDRAARRSSATCRRAP